VEIGDSVIAFLSISAARRTLNVAPAANGGGKVCLALPQSAPAAARC